MYERNLNAHINHIAKNASRLTQMKPFLPKKNLFACTALLLEVDSSTAMQSLWDYPLEKQRNSKVSRDAVIESFVVGIVTAPPFLLWSQDASACP